MIKEAKLLDWNDKQRVGFRDVCTEEGHAAEGQILSESVKLAICKARPSRRKPRGLLEVHTVGNAREWEDRTEQAEGFEHDLVLREESV